MYNSNGKRLNKRGKKLEYKRIRRNVIYLVIIGIIFLIIQLISIPFGILYGLDTSYTYFANPSTLK